MVCYPLLFSVRLRECRSRYSAAALTVQSPSLGLIRVVVPILNSTPECAQRSAESSVEPPNQCRFVGRRIIMLTPVSVRIYAPTVRHGQKSVKAYRTRPHSESSQAKRSASRFHLWRLGWPQLGINLFQGLPLRLQVRLCVVVGRIELRMAKPAPNHGDIHACGDKMDGRRMSIIHRSE